LRLMGLPEGAAVRLDGLEEEGLLVGIRLDLVGLVVESSLDGALEALVSPLVALPYEYNGIIECKHIDEY
jgi:hypothetical protein